MPKEPIAEEVVEEKIIFPEVEIKVTTGRVVIKPWGLKQGRLMLARIRDLMTSMSDASKGATAGSILDDSFDEVYGIVKDTIGWSDEQMEKLTLEDLIDLTQGVMDVCLIREDGGGVLGKMVGLMTTGTRLLTQMSSVTQPGSGTS